MRHRLLPIVAFRIPYFSCGASTAAKIRNSAGSSFRSTRNCKGVVHFQEQLEYHCCSNAHLPERGDAAATAGSCIRRRDSWLPSDQGKSVDGLISRPLRRLVSQKGPFSFLPARLKISIAIPTLCSGPFDCATPSNSLLHLVHTHPHLKLALAPQTAPRRGGCGLYMTYS